MEKLQKIDVSYCGNQKVFPQILLSVLSLIKYSSKPIMIKLMTMDLRDVDQRFTPISEMQCMILDKVLKSRYGESGIELIDARENYLKLLSRGKNVKNGYTPYAQLRLLLDLYPMPDKMLYLDTDIMCCSDPCVIYETDIEEYEFAAVLDYMGKFWIRKDYCNSGVLFINAKRMKEVGTFERARELIIKKRMAFADQSALNNVVRRKLILPMCFNEQREIKDNTVFKHFCKGVDFFPFLKVINFKQTDVKAVHKNGIYMFDDIYEQYNAIAEKYNFNKI